MVGLCVSAAARPTNSVPANAKAAVTSTLQKPLKPLLKAPGSRQYCPPMYPEPWPPAQLIMIPRMMNPITAATLMVEKKDSDSPNALIPNMLMRTIVNKNTVMNAPTGRFVFQN